MTERQYVACVKRIAKELNLLIEAGIIRPFDATTVAMTITPRGDTIARHVVMDTLKS